MRIIADVCIDVKLQARLCTTGNKQRSSLATLHDVVIICIEYQPELMIVSLFNLSLSKYFIAPVGQSQQIKMLTRLAQHRPASTTLADLYPFYIYLNLLKICGSIMQPDFKLSTDGGGVIGVTARHKERGADEQQWQKQK